MSDDKPSGEIGELISDEAWLSEWEAADFRKNSEELAAKAAARVRNHDIAVEHFTAATEKNISGNSIDYNEKNRELLIKDAKITAAILEAAILYRKIAETIVTARNHMVDIASSALERRNELIDADDAAGADEIIWRAKGKINHLSDQARASLEQIVNGFDSLGLSRSYGSADADKDARS